MLDDQLKLGSPLGSAITQETRPGIKEMIIYHSLSSFIGYKNKN